jgi:hypothetical protein
MVSTAIAYTVLTIALVGLLGFTVIVGGILQTAQNVPATYTELGTLTYSVQEQMVSAYRASLNIKGTVYSSIYAPTNIYSLKYTLTVTANGRLIDATCGSVDRTFSLPILPGATWAGTFRSGATYIRISAFYLNGAVTVTMSD